MDYSNRRVYGGTLTQNLLNLRFIFGASLSGSRAEGDVEEEIHLEDIDSLVQ